MDCNWEIQLLNFELAFHFQRLLFSLNSNVKLMPYNSLAFSYSFKL